MTTAYKLDPIDRNILYWLQKEGRITNAQLAQHIGLSPASTLERVRKLEQQQIIQGYRAKVNCAALSLNTTMLLKVKLARLTTNHIAVFKEAIAAIPEVIACYQVVGNTDFILKVVTKDITAYQQLVVERLGEISGITHMVPLLVTDTLKDEEIILP